MKLLLKAKSNNWEYFQQRKKNKKYPELYQKVVSRYNNKCQFSGIVSPHLELINLDNDYTNNTLKNIVPACTLSARCLLLDAYNLEYSGEDKIIYCPELSQVQLNHLIRSLFCTITFGNQDQMYQARTILAQFQDRASWLDEKAGCTLSHPGLFVHYLLSPNKDPKLIRSLRWLPDLETFKDQQEQWQNDITLQNKTELDDI